MAIPTKVLNHLKKNKIKFEILEHKKVFTALDAAETQHLDPRLIVKTMVIKADSNYLLALLSAGRNVDKNKLKKAINVWVKKSGCFPKPVKSVGWAKEAWMKKNMLGLVGATPPFGSLAKVCVFMDAALFALPKLIVNSGEYTSSIQLKAKDFIKLEQPVKAAFSVKK